MTVTVFTNPNNPQCEATEQELSKLGVRYVAVDLTQNPSTFEQIKDAGFKKVQASIQGDELRVTSPSKDELQEVIIRTSNRREMFFIMLVLHLFQSFKIIPFVG